MRSSFLAVIVALAAFIVSVRACQKEGGFCPTPDSCCAGLNCSMGAGGVTVCNEMGAPAHSHNHGLWDRTGLLDINSIAVVPSTFESRIKSQAAFRCQV
ncbi:uncharacterized protein EDB93DRAFT_1186837 [Suillus bovinus]|uniref:uncharacterized protein n=1 Tax=Suillus bovinus TaxID=48563 RepID=UPI001B85EDCD|nr:uncharacterized protein EDB93DRAFT_1186837 [Suillus bovinus]KAG2127303.1 hypothetical protein EDB93DRAFT_1186837 [Suillus bovinus]